MSWAPSAEGLTQLLGLFRACDSASNAQHRQIQLQLVEFNVIPDYNNYLVYILNQLRTEEPQVRQMAGLMLKNNARDHWAKLTPDVQEYVRENLLQCIGDPIQYVRRVVGSCVTTIINYGGLETWPSIVPRLYQALDSPDTNLLDGAFSALHKICEDSAPRLAADVTTQPLQFLIPKFIQFFGHESEVLRRYAVASLYHFVQLMPPALTMHIDTYLQGLFALATDADPTVRKCVCQALVGLLDSALEKLAPHMGALVQYMLQATVDADEAVSLEACEFWGAICDTQIAHEALAPVLPQLIPVLLKGMIYSEDDILAFGYEEANEQQPDRPEDVKPRFHKARVECLASPQWEVRESGILALGAIAEGCMESIKVYLPQLVPWLIQTLADQKFLIRSITCWTLSRYSKWVCEQPEHPTYLQPMMQELLKRVLDHNKKVQEAACSAFATLEEDAEAILVPYLGPILQNLLFAFSKYQAKNLLILYDAIGTLADAVGAALNRPEHIQVLMPPLVQKWSSIADDDRSLFPLLECFTSIAQALGAGFAPYAGPVYGRCVALIEGTLRMEAAAAACADGSLEAPDKEFIVCSLDLISGMTEGMGADMAPLVGASNLSQLLLHCMRADGRQTADVRQSAYALVGDLAKACIDQLRPVLGEYLPVLTDQLDESVVSVCNNASWAIGEVAIKVGGDMRPYIEPMLARLIPIMQRHDSINKSLVENTAITLGRLGLVAPDLGAARLEDYVAPWCVALRSIRDDIEKEHAFQGLCAMIRLNPRAPLNAMLQLCDALASWTDLPPALQENFRQIIEGYKTSIPPEQWMSFVASLPPDLKQRLAERYAL